MPNDGKEYVVVKGDWLNKIARNHGLPSWKDIYYHPKNAGFRKLRPDPNLIYPGDKVWVPGASPKGHKTHSGKSPTGVKKLVANLEVTVKDKTDGKPIENVSVQVLLPEFVKDVTDASGKAKFTGVIKGEYIILLEHERYFPAVVTTTVKVASDKIVENKFETKLQRYPHFESKTAGNRIDIVFDPDNSKKVTKCEKIVHVQFARLHVNGVVTKPGDFLAAWKFRDSIMTSDGWWLDCLATETTPDYQQGVGDGKKNGGSVKAKITDAPTVGNDTVKGAYVPGTNPGGWKTYRAEFATFAWCMKGPDCGTWYEGITWEYSKSWEDHRDGRDGISKITDFNVTAPSKSYLEAFKKFNKKKGFVPCK